MRHIAILCLLGLITLADERRATERSDCLESPESEEVAVASVSPSVTTIAGRGRSEPRTGRRRHDDFEAPSRITWKRCPDVPQVCGAHHAGHRLPNGLNAPLRN